MASVLEVVEVKVSMFEASSFGITNEPIVGCGFPSFLPRLPVPLGVAKVVSELANDGNVDLGDFVVFCGIGRCFGNFS